MIDACSPQELAQPDCWAVMTPRSSTSRSSGAKSFESVLKHPGPISMPQKEVSVNGTAAFLSASLAERHAGQPGIVTTRSVPLGTSALMNLEIDSPTSDVS